MADELFTGVSDALGPIDIDYYAGKPNVTYNIRGVLSLWGAVYLPSTGTPADFFNENAVNPPLVSFQGLKDNVFLPGTSRVLLNKNSNYVTDNKCLVYSSQRSYTYPTTLTTITQSGSSGFYDILQTLQRKVNCELYLDSDMGHGLDNKSDFGFGSGKISTDGLKVYIVSRATTFFQSILNNTTNKLNTDSFQDCVNNRIKSCTPSELRDKNCNTGFTDEAVAPVQNPANTVYNIALVQKNIYINLQQTGLTKIYLSNSAGLIVKSSADTKQQIVLPCNDLQTGIYFLVVQQGAKTHRQKLFIP
jgi:Secretion system C-terminal sorting domain